MSLCVLLRRISCLKILFFRKLTRKVICTVHGETDVVSQKFWIHFLIQRFISEPPVHLSTSDFHLLHKCLVGTL